jgi:hypothetical protein
MIDAMTAVPLLPLVPPTGEPEVPLGDKEVPEAVRVGDTVRRAWPSNGGYVVEVLAHLAAAGFDAAPRVLGSDERGRMVLTYLPGATVDWEDTPALTDAQLRSGGRLVRRFHDATAGTALAGAGEVVGHGDIGPHNIVFQGDEATGLIDFDDALGPVSRLVDLGHAVWCFADVGGDLLPPAEQGRRARLVCDAYGWDDVVAVVDEVDARLHRALHDHESHNRPGPAGVFRGLVAAFAEQRTTIMRAATGATGD